MNDSFGLLKTRRFLPLFLVQFLGTFNANSFKNALIMMITYGFMQSTNLNSQLEITLAAGIFIFPFFLFSATAGELADKLEKSRLISLIKFSEIILMLIAAAGFYFHQQILLLIVLFLLGTQSAFFGPLKYAILPEQLQPKELMAGNGLIEAGTFIAILLGMVLGGSMIMFPHGATIISGILVVAAVSGFITSFIIPKTSASNPNLKIHWNFAAETLRILNYTRLRSDIFLCIFFISWFWLVGSVFLAEFPAFTKNDLHASGSVVTFFFSLFSIGIAIGSVICNKLVKKHSPMNYVALGAVGMALFAIDLYFSAGQMQIHRSVSLIDLPMFLSSLSGLRITLDLLMIAVCGGLFTVPLYTMLQERSDKTFRARVIAANNIMNALFMVLAAVSSIVMLQIGLTVREIFLIVGIANGVMALFIAVKSSSMSLLKAN